MATLTPKSARRVRANASDAEFPGDAPSLVNHVDRDLIYGDLIYEPTERHFSATPFSRDGAAAVEFARDLCLSVHPGIESPGRFGTLVANANHPASLALDSRWTRVGRQAEKGRLKTAATTKLRANAPHRSRKCYSNASERRGNSRRHLDETSSAGISNSRRRCPDDAGSVRSGADSLGRPTRRATTRNGRIGADPALWPLPFLSDVFMSGSAGHSSFSLCVCPSARSAGPSPRDVYRQPPVVGHFST